MIAQKGFEEQIARLREHIQELREQRERLSPADYEWWWCDEALFEARCDLRRLLIAQRMAGRTFACERCGEVYDSRWVASYGLVCHAECDGWLREV